MYICWGQFSRIPLGGALDSCCLWLTRHFTLFCFPAGPRCSKAANVVLMCGSDRVLEVRFLHLIRVDYSVPQPWSRQSHTKGGPPPAHTGALWSEGGAGYLSTATDQSLPSDRLTPSPSTFHSLALMCVCVCVGWGQPSISPEPWWFEVHTVTLRGALDSALPL